MLVKVNSVALIGLDVVEVTVEVNIANRGFPGFDIVGLPTKAVAESRERIKTAIINSGISFPEKRITVNLAPADLPKEGTLYDFPIAAGIIAALKGIHPSPNSLFFGELSLDGSIVANKGALLIGLYAKEKMLIDIFSPEISAKEISLVGGINVYKMNNLYDFTRYLDGEIILPNIYVDNSENSSNCHDNFDYDFSQIIGQAKAKRALEISAAGGHNILLIGSPGAGKTSLAKVFPSILPPLTDKERLEVTRIYSSVGLIDPVNPIIVTRKLRSPHHTISYSGLVGGGSVPKVGELSLAHKGILFLDEFSEFPRNIIDSLRQPLEDKKLTISRSKSTATFPCDFTLFAASNPCPCGYLGHPTKQCICTDSSIQKYRSKLSGPILDRIDLFVEVPPVAVEELSDNNVLKSNESSVSVRKRVVTARNLQLVRNGGITNNNLQNEQIKKYCPLDFKSKNLLNMAITKYNMSARSYFKTIKVARTIADLAESKSINFDHIAEALQYKNNL